jgi:hypothetical protein
LEDNVQVEKEAEPKLVREEERAEIRTPEVSSARIERMKRAFKPTWLYDQINAVGKNPGSNGKKD